MTEHTSANTWAEGRLDFDKMTYIDNEGIEIKMVVKDGRVYVLHQDTNYYATFSEAVQELYQEYISKLIEEELLKEK